MKTNRSFTLLELVITSSILMLIMLGLYVSFNAGIFAYRHIEGVLDTAQTALKTLEHINSDLRNSFAYSTDEPKFTGSKNEISFLTLVDTFREDKKAQDYAFVLYKLEENNLLRLCRRNQESLNDKIEISPKILAPNVEEIVFSYGYFNPEKQTLEWKDAPDIFPVAVKVSLTIKNKVGRDNEAGQNFERIIFFR